jgi:hypothetical protein
VDALHILGWLGLGYVVLRAVGYILGARVYFTCALREGRAHVADSRRLSPAQIQMLSVFDSELHAAGFQHLGFGSLLPILTYYEAPMLVSVLVSESMPAYALVRRQIAPEYGSICELALVTEFSDGRGIQTTNARFAAMDAPANMRVEEQPGLAVADLISRHAAHLASENSQQHAIRIWNLEDVLDRVARGFVEVRDQFRKRGWVSPTANPALDSFTLRGAFALAHFSMRVSKPQGRGLVPQSPASTAEQNPSLRVEADLDAVMRRAAAPERAPGTPWPLLTVIAVTVLMSFTAMALLWNVLVATLILAVVIFHEAGHALTMRLIGYRDVHVFFVPLLGAVTVGHSVVSRVRDRVAMLLAGPVPGLWLAVLLLLLDRTYGPMGPMRVAALALLLLNGLNLLPITPLDGGRVMELLSRHESPWRLFGHVVSVAGLVGLAIYLRDPALTVMAVVWALMFRRQLRTYRLRRAVAQKVLDPADFHGVVRIALEEMATPHYVAWRSPMRQAIAHALGKQFAEPVATSTDRIWSIMAYVSGWVPVLIALALW